MHTTSIRDFKKEKVLGKGSFGSVYLVRRKQDNKIYALKTVIMEKLNKREQENSVNEVRILASVNHPNVIGYKEAFWDDDGNTGSSLNIVMEYADDGDLHSKIEKMKKAGGFFKEPIIWSYAIQMIEGLKALHDKKIMHRDLKSANIFLVKDKHQCKLGDMNVSKVIKEKVLKTQTGTPYYASPEVWNDNPYSYKSDLWSIGCVIYELCALRPPFQGKDLDELYENVCKGKPERINKIYSDDLWKMILMLLQVDVDKRVDCNQFLNSDLIKKKIEEMKNNPKTFLEALNLDKNKKVQDDEFLLKTIKFNDISEIKAQLPTKKNYSNNISGNNLKHSKTKGKINKGTIIKKINYPSKVKYENINEEYLAKLKDIKKEKELVKKELAKQIEYEKIREYLIKNNEKIKEKEKNKEKEKEKEKLKNTDLLKENSKKQQQRTGNYLKDNYDNILRHHKTVIYKKSNCNKNRFPTSENRDSFSKIKHPEIEISNINSSKRLIKGINSERRKKTDLSDLYLKKYAIKNNKIPIENYNKLLLNNKLSMASLSRKTAIDLNSNYTINNSNNNNSNVNNSNINNKENKDNNKELNCFTSVERIKKNNNIQEEDEETEVTHTIDSNKYVYNKKNIIIKKPKMNNNSVQERPLSATPIYKRIPALNPSLYQSNLKQSGSYANKQKIIKNNQNKVATPSNAVKKNNKKGGDQFYEYKLNRYYSYGITMTSPSNNTINKNENELILNKNQSSINYEKDKKKEDLRNKKYIKKLNVKSYKIKDEENKENNNEQKELYGKCFEREKNKDKIKDKKIPKKKINIYTGNNNGISVNNSNTFLQHIKNINTPHNGCNPVLNCYLSPKCNNSQVFNNFYSINCGGSMNMPVKVINVYKK